MSKDDISELIKKLDSTRFSEQETYWEEIKKLNIDIPKYFLEAYPTFKKWQGRLHLVFSCIKYARTSESAFQLGIKALSDNATLVRYRAASVLAYSLRKDAIPYLRENLNHHDNESQKDAERAIKAIMNQNHHIFMQDRADTWIVNPETDEKRQIGIFDRIKKIIKK